MMFDMPISMFLKKSFIQQIANIYMIDSNICIEFLFLQIIIIIAVIVKSVIPPTLFSDRKAYETIDLKDATSSGKHDSSV